MDKERSEERGQGELAERAKRFLKHVWEHFEEDRCFEEAASLGYTSLLSLVPLMAVVFGIIAAFPVFNEWSDRLQSFIFDNFMPSTGEQIVPYLNTFLDSVSRLTLPGMLALFATALLLLNRIEAAFNRIWRVAKGRTIINRVVMYWAVLTLVPILTAAAMAFTVQKVLGVVGEGGALGPMAYSLATFLMTWALIALMFLMVPNRSVRVQHALTGAFLSAVLFELAKAGFVAYVSNANYTVIYGALATIPIFLFWLYLVWTVILFGASLASSLTSFSDFDRLQSDWPERWSFQMAFRLVGHLRDAQKRGETLSREQLMDMEPLLGEILLLDQLEKLGGARIVASDEDGNWLLARDLGDLKLSDLYHAGSHYLPLNETGELPVDSRRDEVFVSALEEIAKNGGAAWTQSLKEMYEYPEQGNA